MFIKEKFKKPEPQNWKEKLAARLGFVPKVELDACILTLDRTSSTAKREIDRLEKEKIDRLVKAIHEVRMVKVAYDEGNITWNADSLTDNIEPSYRTIDPPNENWYQLITRIDAGVLQRIYYDLQMAHNSYEYEYFVESILREIRNNIDVLMRIKQ